MKMVPWFASLVGSYIGWWLGARWGFMGGFMISLVGAGVGMYYGRKWVLANLS